MRTQLVRAKVALLALVVTACGYDNGDKDRVEAESQTETSYGLIDTDAQMENLDSGVGVFVTYASGGEWTIQFGCDTATSDLNCYWDVRAYTQSGGRIQGFSTLDFESADYAELSTDGIAYLLPTTTTDLDGVTLTIDEGEALTLDVWLEGESNPNDFVFWMSGGVVVEGADTRVISLTPTEP